MSEKIYARVEQGAVVQFPITISEINERNDPLETYLECFFAPSSRRPMPSLGERIVYDPFILGPIVYVEEKLVKKSIEEMFTYLHEVATLYDSENRAYLERSLITPELYTAFEDVVKVKVQACLDEFAQSRGYDSFGSVVGYLSSTYEKYRAEALRAAHLRDLIWPVLYERFNGIIDGTFPIPNNWGEVHQYLPALTWEDEV